MSLLTTFFGDANKRHLDNLYKEVAVINGFEAEIEKISDTDLRAKTKEFKDRLTKGSTLDDIAPEAFAVVREASKRTLNMRHFDVQLLGGMVLHSGQVAEMRTGEGKTLVSTLALYLNALEGKGAHLVTVNDYLAKRDAAWMGQIFDFLGLSVGIIAPQESYLYDPTHTTKAEDDVRDEGVVIERDFLRPVQRAEAYAADITYGTNNEFGFDYLRDNMVQSADDRVQRDLHYAIIDEVDSILIDEARTPLIISAPDAESTDKYMQFAALVETLVENTDYNIDEKDRAATLTDVGIQKIEKALNVNNIYEQEGIETVHHIEQALKAKAIFKRDKDYVVKDGEILIVDEFTGRMLQGRRYSEGLHQAIEAKEGVAVQRENRTMATITFQNYFRMYKKLSGMTGTAATEAEEMAKIYNLDVTTVPTNQPMVREDGGDQIYKTNNGKLRAIVAEIRRRHELGQPILVGTVSVAKNEELAAALERAKLAFNALNAKQHEREAEIIAQAGTRGAITIATNMAGRGVDIKLGGIPFNKEKYEEIKSLGGLHVIGTERHESRRIDNQLRGRAGRQGDPGSSQFYVSMEDDLMRIFGSDRMKTVMDKLGLDENTPIENKMISRSIESAQKRVEGHNFDIRKHLVEYDDIINKHREVIYSRRSEVLEKAQSAPNEAEASPLTDLILDSIREELIAIVGIHTAETKKASWNLKEIKEVLKTIFPLSNDEERKIDESIASGDLDHSRDALTDYLIELSRTKYDQLKDYVRENMIEVFPGRNPLIELEKSILLRSIDMHWINHLDTISQLRAGIGLRGYGQRDPLVEYKRESKQIFDRLLDTINKQVVYSIFKVSVAQRMTAPPVANPRKLVEHKQRASVFGGAEDRGESAVVEPKLTDAEGHKIGRNDPCFCGSGKKYKKCHGQNA